MWQGNTIAYSKGAALSVSPGDGRHASGCRGCQDAIGIASQGSHGNGALQSFMVDRV